MDLRQLEAFQQIAATGSFKKAAAELNITQSALSHRIRSLEDALETALFVREHRRVRMTAVGEQLARRVSRLFDDLNDLRDEFLPQRTREPHGTLRIAATSVMVSYVYGDILEQFIARYPGVDLQVLGASTPQAALDRLHERSAEVACVYGSQERRDVDWHPIGSSTVELVASPRHALAARDRVTVDDLRAHAFVRHLPGTASRLASDAIFLADGGAYPPVCTESSDVEYVKRIVRLALGVTNLHAFTLERELNEGTLVALPIADAALPVQAFGLALRRGARTVAAQRFLDLCQETAQASPLHFRLATRSGPLVRTAGSGRRDRFD